MTDVPKLSAALGAQVAVIRSKHGQSQDDLARRARDFGLAWTRSSVAALETGRRELLAGELLLLPLVLGESTEAMPYTLPDLLAELVGPVEVAPDGRLSPNALAALARGARDEVDRLTVNDLDVPFLRASAVDWTRAVQGLTEMKALVKRLRPGLRLSESRPIYEASARDAEAKAARKLEVHPFAVALAAWVLWGHGLTDERDARVAAVGESRASATPRSIQALRGRVSRELVADVELLLRKRGVISG